MADQTGSTSFKDKWGVEIGRFVMAFGSIEGMTIALIRSEFDQAAAEVLVASDLGQTS